MLQSKGLSSRAAEEDHEQTRRLADAEMTIHQLEGLLEQKDKETLQLREVWICLSVCSETKMKPSAFKHSIAWVCVCLYVKPDVSMCKSNSFIWKTLWLASLIAHNSDLIKNRNPNTYTNTLDGTLYPVGFAFILVCIFFNATEYAHACCTTAPSSGMSNEQIINVNVLVRKINWMVYFNKAY